ncbi:two-component sensor histidine kinase [Alsobacter soli]|uniref:histidine kinase n=1 Tax=Alsobacter soli TaxID=2109933 RepID=A0A2T1HS75_9HYPH|nr:ATP-binding protein [Alsobacter soli]PSC04505.1 two-component sensor histidine kinase [Alsobacter soli]
MTALGKLFRTTAFKLSLAYLAIFTLFAFFLLGYIAFNARRLIADQVASVVEAETQGLAEQYMGGGLRRLVDVIESRSRQPGASLYLVAGPNGERYAGNIGRLPSDLLERPGQRTISYFHNDDDQKAHMALVRVYQLPQGVRLLVGHDLAEADRLRQVIRRAFSWSLSLVVILALLGGWFVTRRVLGRIDAMTDATRGIMKGDLSGRLAIAGTNDELDRLAVNLNAMLDRIEELMSGMKEVSDNIAHDLKTPLTRLRNGAEEALRTAETPNDYRNALEGTIEEADNLIRVFNALLMIARAEAGNARDNMAGFDVAEVARDVVELYEPVAEEAGVPLRLEVEPGLRIRGSRELIGQALANLVDNAIKYAPKPLEAVAATDGGQVPSPSPEVLVRAGQHGDTVELAVADRGPGIPAADRSRVLERFVRLEGARTRPGFGLGLSLAAAVARLHGGTLRLEDNEPGLRAVVALPATAGA